MDFWLLQICLLSCRPSFWKLQLLKSTIHPFISSMLKHRIVSNCCASLAEGKNLTLGTAIWQSEVVEGSRQQVAQTSGLGTFEFHGWTLKGLLDFILFSIPTWHNPGVTLFQQRFKYQKWAGISYKYTRNEKQAQGSDKCWKGHHWNVPVELQYVVFFQVFSVWLWDLVSTCMALF